MKNFASICSSEKMTRKEHNFYTNKCISYHCVGHQTCHTTVQHLFKLFMPCQAIRAWCDRGSVGCSAVFSGSERRQVFRSCEATRIFWMSYRLLYHCFIHRAWTNYFNSPRRWGADWQLPSSEWSDRFSDLAEGIWCILTIIGATATMMFSKPLCYFPRGCPQGIFFSFFFFSPFEELLEPTKTPLAVGTDGLDCCPLQITHTTA